MKERPILFSGAMVRAILDGSKTQTRRVVKPQPVKAPPSNPKAPFLQSWLEDISDGGIPCPYGQPGDRLWVREAGWWAVGRTVPEGEPHGMVAYRATFEGNSPARDGRWKPSIHMPRWASRITLEVAGVRVERVQCISEADVFEEGIAAESDLDWTPRAAYAALWDSINAARGYGWDANPWVWVVEFKRV